MELVPSEFPEEVFTDETKARSWLANKTKENGGNWPNEKALRQLKL